MEADHRQIPERQDGPAAQPYPESVSGIVEDLEAVGVGDPLQAIDLAGRAVDVHGQDGRRLGRDERLHPFWV